MLNPNEFTVNDLRFELVNDGMTINVYLDMYLCFLDIINVKTPLDNISFWAMCCEYEWIESNCGGNL